MLTTITGNPGAGKTLYMVWAVNKLALESNRPVYYFGIEGVSLDWIELTQDQLQHWPELVSDGSIVCFDEAWSYFPAVKAGDKRPAWVEAFATHRHRGLDVFMTTQHGTQVDTFIRKMSGMHIHIVRAWGANAAKLYKWQSFQSNPGDPFVKKDALTEVWRYPKEAFNYYKSAQIHTKVQRPPWRKFAYLAVAVLGVPLALWFGYSRMPGVEDSEQAGIMDRIPRARDSEVERGPSGSGAFWEAERWLARVGHPASSPGFDHLVYAVSRPRLSGYLLHEWSDGRRDCWASDQRGNKVVMDFASCRRAVREGRFDFLISDAEYMEAREYRFSLEGRKVDDRQSPGDL